MTAFEFATATRIIFGSGALKRAGVFAADMGKTALIVTGKHPERADFLLNVLHEQGIEYVIFSVSGEPAVETITSGMARAREAGCDMVIGIGGGSALDAAKAIGALMTNPGELTDYLEVIGHARPLSHRSAPCIAIPTTAGTGSEVTCNAVLAASEHRVKVSLRSPFMFPDIAMVDPELTRTMPPDITAATGLDALTQLIEAYVSHKANPLTDSICREGIKRAGRSLVKVYENGSDREAREDMALASLFSGIALTNAKLGAVHGLAGPLGGMFPAPHGVLCGRLLPYVMEVNIRALKDRSPESPGLKRYEEIAAMLTGKTAPDPETGVRHAQKCCADLNIPGLARFGLGETDFEAVVKKALNASSMKGNPIQLTEDDIREILERAL